MRKVISVVCSFVLFGIYGMAQSDTPDLKVYKTWIQINRLTDAVVDSVNNVEDKEYLDIEMGKTATQADFDRACKEFTWISSLRLPTYNQEIHNIEGIANLTSLSVLKVYLRPGSRKEPIDLEPLSKLTELIYIDFNGTRVKNPEALNNLRKLAYVSFYMSGISSISFLCNNPNILNLNLYGSRHTFENYEPIACLKKLKFLNIYANKQATDEGLEVLKSLTNLRRINLSANSNVTSLDFLKNNTKLEELGVSVCRNLKDFSAIAGFQKLKELSAGSSGIESLDVLAEVTSLEKLKISDTQISDLSALTNHPKLKYIDLSDSLVEDISPLYACKALRTVRLNLNMRDFDEKYKKLRSINNGYVDIKTKY